jgi:hypothetical protein
MTGAIYPPAWLNLHGLVHGVMAWGCEGPVRLHLTDDGVTCAEEFGSDTARFTAAQGPDRAGPRIDRPGGTQLGPGDGMAWAERGQPRLRQDLASGRDAYASGRDMYVAAGDIHVHEAPPTSTAGATEAPRRSEATAPPPARALPARSRTWPGTEGRPARCMATCSRRTSRATPACLPGTCGYPRSRSVKSMPPDGRCLRPRARLPALPWRTCQAWLGELSCSGTPGPARPPRPAC